METVEQILQPNEKLNQITKIIEEMLAKDGLTYAEYKEKEAKINELQQGLDDQIIESFGEKMQAIWEKIKDKPE